MLELDQSSRPIICLIRERQDEILTARGQGFRIRTITGALHNDLIKNGRKVAERTVYEYVKSLLKEHKAKTQAGVQPAPVAAAAAFRPAPIEPEPSSDASGAPTVAAVRKTLNEKLSRIGTPVPLAGKQGGTLLGSRSFVPNNLTEESTNAE